MLKPKIDRDLAERDPLVEQFLRIAKRVLDQHVPAPRLVRTNMIAVILGAVR